MPSRTRLLFAYTTLCLSWLNYANAIDVEIKIESFSWLDCGPSAYPDHVKSLTVSPDPIKIPGNPHRCYVGYCRYCISNRRVAGTHCREKSCRFWIKVPCIDKLGSCTYDDVCTTWATVCPKYFEKYGLPCACPIPANTYTVSDVVLDVTEKLPPGSTGDIRVTTNFVSKSAGTFLCLQLLATVAAN